MPKGYDRLPMGEFATGYVVGWEAVKGLGTAPMFAPLPPRIPTFGFTSFLEGVRTGIEHALGVDDIEKCASGTVHVVTLSTEA